MASENENAFKEQFQAAVIAKKRGAWGTARRYFLEAERSMRDAASAAMSDELKTRSNAMADRMKAEALDCAAALEDGRKCQRSRSLRTSFFAYGLDTPRGELDGVSFSDGHTKTGDAPHPAGRMRAGDRRVGM